MSNINVYLRENLGAISVDKVFIAPNIAEKRMNNAVKSFGYLGSISSIIALYDNTIFGSGKNGLLFTGEQFIYHASFSDPISIAYSSIISAEYCEALAGSKKDKIEATIEITTQDGGKVIIKDLLDCNYKKLVEVLQTTISEFDEYKEEKQLISIGNCQSSCRLDG
jgi:hypothetical protein